MFNDAETLEDNEVRDERDGPGDDMAAKTTANSFRLLGAPGNLANAFATQRGVENRTGARHVGFELRSKRIETRTGRRTRRPPYDRDS